MCDCSFWEEAARQISLLVCSRARGKADGNCTKQVYWHKCCCLHSCRSGSDFPLFFTLSSAIAASHLASLMSQVTQPFKKEQEHSKWNSPFHECISESQSWQHHLVKSLEISLQWAEISPKEEIIQVYYFQKQLICTSNASSQQWIPWLAEHRFGFQYLSGA